ncbi:sigma-70 family RNA polymerase sigma factor [Lentzea sp. NPDC058450]|uniref:sigma-70 family RNA polymerase sigma factor n=1 Tax=Lentzea sp. NPDC058450 TaxID=3346505 RepID=UPI00365B2EAF
MSDLVDERERYTDPQDVELVLAVQRARRPAERKQAFEVIVRKYRVRVLRWCLSRLGDEVNAHDACQDTFEAALAGIGQVKEPHRLRSWLYTISKRRCIAIINGKRERGIVASDMTLEIEEHQRVEHELDDLQQFFDRLLDQVIDSLGPAERDHARVVSSGPNLSGEELAARLGTKTAQGAWSLAYKIRVKISSGLRALALARKGREDCALLDGVVLKEKDWKGEEVFTKYLRTGIAFHWNRCRTAFLSHPRNECWKQTTTCTHCSGCARKKDEQVKEYMPAMAPVLAALPWNEPLADFEDDENEQDGQAPPARRRGTRALVAGAALLIVAILVLLFAMPDSQEVAAPPPTPPFRSIAYTSNDNVWLLPAPGEQPRPVGEPTTNRVQRLAGWSADGRLMAFSTQTEDAVGVYLYEPSSGKRRAEGCQGCNIGFVGSTPVITDVNSPTGFSTFPLDGGGAPFTVSGLSTVSPVENFYGNLVPRFAFSAYGDQSGQDIYLIESPQGPERFPFTLYSVDGGGVAKSVYSTNESVFGAFYDSSRKSLLVIASQDGGNVVRQVDPRSGAALSPDLTVERSAVTGAQGLQLATMGFDDQGSPYAVTVAVGNLSWDPATGPQVEKTTATTYRLSGGTWVASADPLTTDVGNGWTATMTYDSVAGKVALGTLVFRKEGSTEISIPSVSKPAVLLAG